jgi:hypothetical protein
LPNIGIELLREILLPKHDEKKGMRNLRKKTKKKLYVETHDSRRKRKFCLVRIPIHS